MIEIMVVDDQRLVRRCISAKLNAVPDFSVTAEAASGEEARDAVRAKHFDVILMDLNMPGIGGLEATRRVLAVRPECRILGLSMYVSGPYPKQFLRTGGAGYVSKNTDTDELVRAIRKVCDGECYISADVAQHIATSDSLRVQRHGIEALSRREIQVLQKIAIGLPHEEIALRLCLSAKTVAQYRRQLLEKLGARNDVQLAVIARDQGLADIDSLPDEA
ncbi:MAG: response regulator transcription factor [Gammaproteobacteria bacterium]|nr:response regulator transcription factor [Gammaproteobacteria bacterium]